MRDVTVFLVRRLVRLLVSLVVVSLLTFTLLQFAPGDFASIQEVGGGDVSLAGNPAEAQSRSEIAARYGNDKSVVAQYLTFMKGVVTFDIGPSYRYPQLTVEGIIAKAFPVSAILAVLATALALVVAVPVGALAAIRRGRWWDGASMFVVTLGHGVPNYLAALVLVLIFAVAVPVLPAYGWRGPQSMVLPVIALAVSPIAVLARYVRNSMLETLRDEYVVAAQSRGLTPSQVVGRHVLRNSLMPLVTVTGPLFAGLATGTIFVEKIFGIPGLGAYFTEAAAARDMPLLMATTLFFATLLMVINVLVDLSYAVIDPRVRLEVLGDSSSRGTKGDRGAGDVEDETVIVEAV